VTPLSAFLIPLMNMLYGVVYSTPPVTPPLRIVTPAAGLPTPNPLIAPKPAE
jgi:hypothetical protein